MARRVLIAAAAASLAGLGGAVGVEAAVLRGVDAGDAALLRDRAPELVRLLELEETDPEALAEAIRSSPLAAVAAPVAPPPRRAAAAAAAALPIVTAHGMGDSCYNSGMKSLTEAAGARVGAYAVCVPTADGRLRDTIDGFLKNMDKSVDAFAERVRADPKLAGGFNAFGLSQGNNVIRGYIMKYNDPPVHTFMSICGINAGVGAFPQCPPSARAIGGVCTALAEVLGDLAYLKVIQDILFQADYYRDPLRLNDTQYLANSQLARWNGEGGRNETEVANYLRTEQFVWVEGTRDTVVWPRAGEWWGDADPSDPWHATRPMNATDWFATDSFGLRSADAAGKNHFESFQGNHIQFSDAELYGWLDKYFV